MPLKIEFKYPFIFHHYDWKYLPYAYKMLKKTQLLRFDITLGIYVAFFLCCNLFIWGYSLFITSPLVDLFSFPFEVTNLKNAIEFSYNQLVQSNAFKILRSRDGINFFALLH